MTYAFPDLIVYAAAGATVVASVATFIMRRRGARGRNVLVMSLITVILGGMLLPSLVKDRVVFDDEHVVENAGMWFAPSVFVLSIADTESIRIEESTNYKGITQQVWWVTKRDGSVSEFHPGDLWETNADDIVERLRARGVPIAR